MASASGTSRRSTSTSPAPCLRPTRSCRDGLRRSASITITRRPSAAAMRARLKVSVDLPSPGNAEVTRHHPRPGRRRPLRRPAQQQAGQHLAQRLGVARARPLQHIVLRRDAAAPRRLEPRHQRQGRQAQHLGHRGPSAGRARRSRPRTWPRDRSGNLRSGPGTASAWAWGSSALVGATASEISRASGSAPPWRGPRRWPARR